MRLSRFFLNIPLSLGEFDLPSALAHYMVKVLRLKEQDPIQLFDGSGKEFLGSLIEITKKSVKVLLNKQLTELGASRLFTHIGQGLSRGDRMDFVIQKATELGVSEITPLFTARSEVRLSDERANKRMSHWEQIAISACEQCGRSKLPIINAPTLLQDWIALVKADLKLMLHPAAEPMSSYSEPSSIALLIGPEGGLTDEEIEKAEQQCFKGVCLGGRILRTETAPIVALTVAQQLWGDFRIMPK